MPKPKHHHSENPAKHEHAHADDDFAFDDDFLEPSELGPLVQHANHMMDTAMELTHLMVEVGEHRVEDGQKSVLTLFDEAMSVLKQYSPAVDPLEMLDVADLLAEE